MTWRGGGGKRVKVRGPQAGKEYSALGNLGTMLTGDVLSFKENAEYEAILNNLTYSPEDKRWTAAYPFIENPGVLTDNKGQALACMKSLEKRLKKQRRLEEFNAVFQETVDRGVFRELTKEEMDNWQGPVNYISMVEAFKQGPQSTTPIRICMNSSMKQPPPPSQKVSQRHPYERTPGPGRPVHCHGRIQRASICVNKRFVEILQLRECR
jgi:hypothetical protein